jgi:hypothetical protein
VHTSANIRIRADVRSASGPQRISLLDANYRRVPGQDEFGRYSALSTAVHASGCAPVLLYVLLYGPDTYASRNTG